MRRCCLSARRELLFRTIRSLIEDALMVVGRIGGDDVERVDPWNLPLDDAMARIYDEYVVHLTIETGCSAPGSPDDRRQRAAQALEAKKSEG